MLGCEGGNIDEAGVNARAGTSRNDSLNRFGPCCFPNYGRDDDTYNVDGRKIGGIDRVIPRIYSVPGLRLDSVALDGNGVGTGLDLEAELAQRIGTFVAKFSCASHTETFAITINDDAKETSGALTRACYVLRSLFAIVKT
jgi:hypothetical protein